MDDVTDNFPFQDRQWVQVPGDTCEGDDPSRQAECQPHRQDRCPVRPPPPLAGSDGDADSREWPGVADVAYTAGVGVVVRPVRRVHQQWTKSTSILTGIADTAGLTPPVPVPFVAMLSRQ